MLSKYLYLAAGAAVAIGLAFGAGYVKGLAAGRIDQLQDTIEAYEDRNGVDETVEGYDRVALCIELGGLPDECAELRGVEEDPG